MHPPSALKKPYNVLGQCFINILVLSCDLEPIGFEEGFQKCVGTERVRERESGQETRRMVQSRFAPHTSEKSGEAAKTYSEYPEAKQLDVRAPVDTK